MTEITNIEKLKEALEKAQDILIVLGDDYSLDELAAGLSLGLSLEKSGKKITIFSTKPPIVEQASLFGIAKIVNSLNSGNLIISIPNALASVDKVTHYLDGETLKIVVHPAGGVALAQDLITMTKLANLPDLVILIDIPWSKLADKLNTQEQKIYTDVPKITIGKTFNQLEDETGVFPIGGACLSETTVWISTKLNLPIDNDCASNLFQGMRFATNFTPPAATAATFEAASICLAAKPVLPQVPKEDARFPAIDKSGLAAKSQSSRWVDSGQDLPISDVLQTREKIGVQEDSQLGSLDEENKIRQDWLGPKIFKSSAGPKKT